DYYCQVWETSTKYVLF
nr:immunoglobulin light chain junction region [Macaca mulatta]MOW68052.1 immunoglobulin light chain junction region [Macaca mulatta]MOW69204.1 immunoglobulin light chain junction region [Macaca mulatta]MOW70434.1 immunoglobulin light chain junction region [Macaca mulatta]MOW71395.1 immunoglobulin light chain junction region [Macaca mulatta]